MKSLLGIAAAALAFLTTSIAQTHPTAEARRFTRGVPTGLAAFTGNASYYQSAVIPADQQRGIALNATGNNAALYGNAPEAQLPWFCRVQRNPRYHITANQAGALGYAAIDNPIAAFGELGGGTPLYSNRDYRFGAFAGFRNYSDAQNLRRGIFRIRAYLASALASGQTNVAHSDETTFELPWPGDANWNQFLLAGATKVVDFHGLKTTIEIVGGAVSDGNPEQWYTWNDPFIITHRASSTAYYFVVEFQGWTVAGIDYPIVTNTLPASTATAGFSPLYVLDFTGQPAWRSTFVHAPQFAGEPVPSWYYGKSLQELQGTWGFSPSTPPDSMKSDVGPNYLDSYSAELRSHTLLDDFVTSMGSDPIALANYVFNEIELTDPVSYNENGDLNEASINCGGLNRGALATFLEKQGNPWEQSALLVYLLRRANVPAVYCEPAKDKLGMLDTQLSHLLRMQVKGAQTPAGSAPMPQIVPTNYPWVTAWIASESRWVHLFPWLKDTEIIEGGNLYDQFPDNCKNGSAWVRKYLQADTDVVPDQIAAYQQDAGVTGLVAIEAEGFHEQVPKNGKRWEPLTETDEIGSASPSGYSGVSWMRAMPNTGIAFTSSGFSGQAPRLDYQIDFNHTGTHYVWIRGQGANNNDTSVYVGLDGVEPDSSFYLGGFGTTFGWKSNQAFTINVPSIGRHTLNVWMRQDGFRFDKVVLTSLPESSFSPGEAPNDTILLEAEFFSEKIDGGATYPFPSPGFVYKHSWNALPGQGLMGSSNVLTTGVLGPALLKYGVTIPHAAVYNAWIYGKADAANKTAQLSLDGSSAITATFGTTLAWRNAGQIYSEAGEKSLSLIWQIEGVSADKLLLVRDMNYVPTGTGYAPTPKSKQNAVESNVPSNLFPRYARAHLAANTSLDNLGVSIRDRNYFRTTWDAFPKPFQLQSGAHQFYERLADRANTFDTVRVQLWSDRNNNGTYEASTDGPYFDTGEWLSAELHNRRFYTTSRKTAANTHQLRLYLAPFRAGLTDDPNFSGANRLQGQLWTATLQTNADPALNDDNLQFEITRRMQKRAWKVGVVSIDVINQGSGYTGTPAVSITAPPVGTYNRNALATAVVSGNKIVALTITDPGSGYMVAPTVTITGGGGTGATAKANLEDAVARWTHPLGISVNQLTTQKPTIRKGELAAICLNFGKVTDAMLRLHAEDFWGQQRLLQGQTSLSGDPDFQEKMQSISAYLMGMEYYNRVGTFKDTDERLHKTRIFSMYAAGLSKLAPYRDIAGALPNSGDVIPRLATVDMFFLNAAYGSNAAVHGDSGLTFAESTKDFWQLLIAEVSAQEHAIINDFYKESAAISTIKLLHRAQTASGILRLTKSNFTSYGSTSYTFGSTAHALSDWDPSMWSAVTAAFSGAAGDYAEVFITPGPVASASATYTGMGALVFNNNTYSALISGNMNLSNGGTGSPLLTPYFDSIQLPNLMLTSSTTGYSLGITPQFSTFNSIVAPATTSIWNADLTAANLTSFAYTPANYLTNLLTTNSALYGLTLNGNLGTYFTNLATRGTLGDPSDFGTVHSAFAKVTEWALDPVNTITGEFYVDAADLSLPGPFPLHLRRNYSSQALSDNEFGQGWKLAYFPYLVVGDVVSNSQLLYGAEMDGSVIGYRRDTVNTNLFTPKVNDNPSLKNLHEGGVGSTANTMNNYVLKTNEAGTDVYTLYGPNGQARRFKVKSFQVGSITRSRPYLENWKDAQGNTLTFSFYNSSTDSRYGQLKQILANNGNFLGFDYDVYGHIIEAWAGDGRRVKYTYDSQGDLRTVTLPDGAVHNYDYQQETTTAGGESVQTSKHLLIRETKPNGRILENVYHADGSRRVVTQKAVVDAGTPNPVINATFDYHSAQNADKTWTGYTIVQDADNRSTRFDFANSLVTSEDDPETPPEMREWYPANSVPGSNGAYPRSLKQITDRRGVVTFFKYDARGNLLEQWIGTTATQTTPAHPADLDGDGNPAETVATIWTYETIAPFDRVKTETDPSGVITKWFYEDPLYPYLASRIEKWAPSSGGGAAQFVAKTLRWYGNPLDWSGVYGHLVFEQVAFGSADEFNVFWSYDTKGFPTNKYVAGTASTGYPPFRSVYFVHNFRGELIEEADTLGRKWIYGYDAMGRRISSERQNEWGALVSWDYTYFNLNGEPEWSDGPRYDPEDYAWRKYDGHGRQTEEIRWRAEAKGDGSGVFAPAGDTLTSTSFAKYDLYNNLIESRDPRHNSVTMSYDGIGRMIGKSFYDGYFGAGGTLKAGESFTYEPGGKVWTHTDVLGGTTTLLYNARGQMRKRTNTDGSVEEWRYYKDGRVFKEILRNGSYWETTYEDFNRVVTRRLKNSGGTVLKTQVKGYDRRGNCISETIDGATFTNTYDGLDRLKTSTGPTATGTTAQQMVTYSYPDGEGREVDAANGLGEKTITMRDALGRMESEEVRTAGDVVVRKTSYAYSADHSKVTVTEGSGSGAVVTQHWTDTFGNTTLTKKADGTVEYFFYDNGGLLTDHFDRALRETFYARNWRGDVTQEVRPGGVVVNYVPDAAGNVLQRNMPGGLIEQAQFDAAGRMQWSKLLQGGGMTRMVNYAYYPSNNAWVGLLNTATDARGIVTTTSYDTALRVATQASTGPDAEDAVSRTLGYNERDQLTSLAESGLNGTTQVTRTFDGYGAISTENVSIGGVGLSALTQSWSPAGRRSQLDGAGATRTFGYRADGLWANTVTGGNTYSATYSDNGLLATRTNPFRSVTVQARDTLGRTTDLRTTVGGVLALEEALPTIGSVPGWNNLDKINRVYSTRAGAGAWNEYRDYIYDNSGRLIYEDFTPFADFGVDAQHYFYDGSGSAGTTGGAGVRTFTGRDSDLLAVHSVPGVAAFARVTSENVGGSQPRSVPFSGVAFGAGTVKLTLDSRDIKPVIFPGFNDPQGNWSATALLAPGYHYLTATATHPSGWVAPLADSFFQVLPRAETVTNTYDEMGNVASRIWSGGKNQTLTWDGRGRLVKVVQTGVSPFTWTALYDGLDRRIGTSYTPDGSATVTTNSVFDPQAEFLELGLSIDGQMNWKVYGPDLSERYGGLQGLGGLEAVVGSDGVTRGIVSDWFGNTAGYVTAPGTALTWNSAQFLAWGPVPGWSTLPLDGIRPLHELLGYRGLTLDPPGYRQMGLRLYDAQTARWLSPDSLGHEASLSLYEFCNNDPLNVFDPDGRFGKGVLEGGGNAIHGFGEAVSHPITTFNNFKSSISSGWDNVTFAASGIAQDVTSGNFTGYGTALSEGFHEGVGNLKDGRKFGNIWGTTAVGVATWEAGGVVLNTGKAFTGGFASTSLATTNTVLSAATVGAEQLEFGFVKEITSQPLNPKSIAFSQNSVTGAKSLTQYFDVHGYTVPPVDVVKLPGGNLVSLDNTRILAAQRSGINVQAMVRSSSEPLPPNLIERFTTRRGGEPATWGDALNNRIGNQNKDFRNTYPQGSPIIGSHD